MNYVQPFDIEDAIRHDVTCACNTCGAGSSSEHRADCPAAAYVADRDAMLALLRRAEWSGSAGRCPWCNEWPETGPTDGLGNPTHVGHADDCALAAILARYPETP
jgi:hypothetical protein